jgi:isopenicillin N synthase-like dioxygenase
VPPLDAHVPIIDIGPWRTGAGDRAAIARAIAHACREWGFFHVTGHGVDEALQRRLENVSRRFFAQDIEAKMAIRMERGGLAWRGYFPVGGELTSGRPDVKEGLYFGDELPADHPLVAAGTPLHGPNLFPAALPECRDTVLTYIDAMTRLGHTIMAAMASSLELPETYFADRYTADPLILFRIFNYPGDPAAPAEGRWGVGEHTDYGFLTILKQDETGGLQVKSHGQWIDAPPVPGAFLCNIGDMLDRITGGRYRSTPHRVRNATRDNRLSFPFFFDPNFHAEVRPIELPDAAVVAADRDQRWDRASVHDVNGTYGEYLLGKVSRVFPQLQRDVLRRP